MTAFNGIKIDCDVFFANRKTVTLSGTVTDGTNPLRRKIVAYSYPLLAKPYSVFSSTADGSFSVNVQVSPQNRYSIIAIGEAGENSAIYDCIEE